MAGSHVITANLEQAVSQTRQKMLHLLDTGYGAVRFERQCLADRSPPSTQDRHCERSNSESIFPCVVPPSYGSRLSSYVPHLPTTRAALIVAKHSQADVGA